MEASALHAPVLNRPSRLSLPAPLLRLRSDDQLVALFRAGSEDAFRTIHDRYRARLLAYAGQMLPGSRSDAEDALQDVFVRAYAALRANDREIALRPWLYRVAHNRCIDELRRPGQQVAELSEDPAALAASDPGTIAERRDDLAKLVTDVSRLPEQQRSAILMRELNGLAYADIAEALDVTVPAVKSLLVRARVGLADAAEARNMDCGEIRIQLAEAREKGVRASGQARRHMKDCGTCRAYKGTLRATERQLAALAPPVGLAALVGKLLGFGGGGAAAGGGAAGGATLVGGAATGAVAAAGHVVAVVAVAAIATGGAVEVSHQIAPVKHRSHHAPAHSAPASIPATVRVPPLPVRSLVAPAVAAPEAKPAPHPSATTPAPVTTPDPAAVPETGLSDAPAAPAAPADPTTTTPSPTDGVTTSTPTTTTVDPDAAKQPGEGTSTTSSQPVATGASVTTASPATTPAPAGTTTTGAETVTVTQSPSGG